MNEIKEKRIESFLEIIILLVATFSFSFFIYEVSKGFGNFNSPVIPLVSADSTSPDLGCCVDPYQGTYDPNVEQAACKTQNGTWYSDATCTSVSGSAYGCCVLGRESQMTTDTHCQRLSEILVFQKTWEKKYLKRKMCGFSKKSNIGSLHFYIKNLQSYYKTRMLICKKYYKCFPWKLLMHWTCFKH